MSLCTNQLTDLIFPSAAGRQSISTGSGSSVLQESSTGALHMFCTTTTSSAVKMGWDPACGTSVAAPTGRFTLATNSVWYVRGMILAARGDYSNGSATAKNPCSFFVEFMVSRGATVGSTVIIGTPTITKTFGTNNDSISASLITITADTTNGNVDVNCTGLFSVTINWNGRFDFIRLT